jgi:hypothetical protein
MKNLSLRVPLTVCVNFVHCEVSKQKGSYGSQLFLGFIYVSTTN